jgi:hypothetical protein
MPVPYNKLITQYSLLHIHPLSSILRVFVRDRPCSYRRPWLKINEFAWPLIYLCTRNTTFRFAYGAIGNTPGPTDRELKCLARVFRVTSINLVQFKVVQPGDSRSFQI